MAINPEANPRTRHVVAHYHFTRERIEEGELELEYIPILEQLADIFTKPLGRSLFEKFRNEHNIVRSESVVSQSRAFP